ncbi:MAG: LysR family transcriptional regulator [Verrucomicrobiales bacterium]|nr:LysR family transcriptional regulator [Verrucomicrobiales bacterium]
MTTPLDSRQLRAFMILARTGSFTRAAKELFLSQSAVSHAMKALEQEVGCRLLDRVGKKVALTQAGEQLLHHAEKILNEMQLARTALEHLGKWGQARLRIGASSTACRYILPPVLSEFKNDYPQCVINIGAGDAADAIESLQNNQIDLAIVLQPKHEDEFDLHPLFEDELAFVLAPSHPWATNGVTRAEVPKQHYILYQKNSYTLRLIEDYFRKEKMVLNTVMELGSMEAIKELVKLGLGISIIAPWIAEKELQEKSLVALPMGKRKLKRTWVIASRKNRRLSIAEETFIKLCRSFAGKMVTTL